MSDPETAVISGQLVTSGGEAGPAGATVEVWDSEGPTAAIPEDVPASAMSSDEGDGGSVANEVLGSGRTNEDGRFRVSVSETPDGVFLRSFDDEGALLGTVTVEDLDPTRPVLVPITLPSSGIGWKGPAAGGVALVALASAYGATQWLGDDDSPGGGGTDGADDVGADGAGDGDDDEDDDNTDGDDPGGSPVSTSPQIDSPDLSGSQVRTPGQQGEFLYAADDPIQRDVDEGAIDTRVSTILRGVVTDDVGNPLEGATVGIQGYPEFGWTETRDTGLFDMVVNGGRKYVLSVDKEGRLPVQRKREVPPQDYVWVDELALVSVDSERTTIEADAAAPQVHRASQVEDDDGQRAARIYFPPGTSASTGNDGGGSPTEMDVRATEYTVGGNGPNAMPAELPPVTGYTYAVELEAEVTGDDGDDGGDGLTRPLLSDAMGDVEFSRPVVLHLENFLDLPVGGAVPTGALGRQDAAWEPVDDGRVVEILDTTDGTASLDVSGSGTEASSQELQRLGISEAERDQLADEFGAGATIWRVAVEHFTPFDCNWTTRPEPEDAKRSEDC